MSYWLTARWKVIVTGRRGGIHVAVVKSDGAGWVTVDEVTEDTEERQRVVRARIEGRDPETGDWTPPASAAASQSISSEWFFASVGVENIHGERETWYFTRGPVGVDFQYEHVVYWTNWTHHAVFVRVKDALERGQFPERLTYGPPRLPVHVKDRPVGPMVLYLFRGGSLAEHKFHWIPASNVKGMAAPHLSENRWASPHWTLANRSLEGQRHNSRNTCCRFILAGRGGRPTRESGQKPGRQGSGA